MAIISGLYPPIVLDTIPAFIRTEPLGCKIYFAIPSYNSINEIKQNYVHISVVNQKTNASALNPENYPTGVKLGSMVLDTNATNDYKYYVTITPQDLIYIPAQGKTPLGPTNTEGFELNTYYKIQLRFTSNQAPNLSNNEELTTWLFTNTDYFSEWSTITLIKGIEEPSIQLRDLDPENEVILSTTQYIISGKYYYSNNKKENEYLKSYKISLYKTSDEQQQQLIYQSNNIYTNSRAQNEINHEIQRLEDGESYHLILQYTTINGYIDSISYNFSIILNSFQAPELAIKAQPDNENGRNKIIITFLENYFSNFTIRRSSSKDDFKKWQDIKNFFFNSTNNNKTFIWYDNTIESGIWYKYCVQKRDDNGNRSAIKMTDSPIICEYEDMYLIGGGRQLKIQFNPTIGDFRYNVTQSQQITIGAKYPFIKRNSENYYRTFSIGGLITSLSDYSNWYDNFGRIPTEQELFTSKEENYENAEFLYSEYNKKNNINQYNDFIYEKEYREKVYDFLYDNTAKLFKSATEGNIIIKLMNIGFQPMENLGRRIYSFSATAIEIDQPTIQNYSYYNIQKISQLQQKNEETFEVLGQIYNSNNSNIWSSINNNHQRNVPEGYQHTLSKLKWIKIQITSAPYYIGNNNNAEPTTTSAVNASLQGYILNMKNKNDSNNVNRTIVIPARQRNFINQQISSGSGNNISTTKRPIYGYYELNSEDTEITGLSFSTNCYYTIDYIAEFKVTKVQNNNNQYNVISYSYVQKIGQEYGTFYPNVSVFSKLYDKYNYNYSSGNSVSTQQLIGLKGINIQAPPNTIVYVKDSKDLDFNKHILTNGYLQLEDPSVNIEEIYFYGTHLTQDNLTFIEHTYNNFNEIENPILNGVYHITSYVVDAISFTQTNQSTNKYSYKKGNLRLEKDKVEKQYSEQMALYKNNKFKQINNLYSLILTKAQNSFDNRYIYYQGEWYPFLEDNNIIHPVDAIINYVCELKRGTR